VIIRGLIIAASGFLFMFSPGVPLGLLARRVASLDRSLIYWGLGLWLAALVPALFAQSLLRQAIYQGSPPAQLTGQPLDYVVTLAGVTLTALCLQGATYWVLRRRRRETGSLVPDGMALGFGIGLIAQVFTGLSLVGAGFRVTLGDTAEPVLAGFGQIGLVELIFSLLPLILFRLALLVVSAARGVLVAWAAGERFSWFWAAVAVDVLFGWLIVAIQIALGADSPGLFTAGALPLPIAIVTMVYYVAAFALAYWWLAGALAKRLQPHKQAGPASAKQPA
jgi:hypothetical protein